MPKRCTVKDVRILFVCMADSTHAQSWVDMASANGFDVRIFADTVFEEGRYKPIEWNAKAFALTKPIKDRGVNVSHIIPNWKYSKPVTDRIAWHLSFNQKFLRHVIRTWKPHIIHSLSLIPSSVFALDALKAIKKEYRPLFVVSSWGSDIYVSKDRPNEREKLTEIFTQCDGFIADCKRDIKNAVELGLSEQKVVFDYGIPCNGGFKIEEMSETSATHERDVILIPKAYEGFANKTLPILEALSMSKGLINRLQIHLLMADFDVQWYLSKLPEDLRRVCYLHQHLPKLDVLALMKRARVMIAPSISDGTPISLLEAMIFGVLPIMSPLESIKEWVTDGENGLLVNPINPNQIADALQRALTDDQLFHKAQKINRKIINVKANRQDISTEVHAYYRRIVSEKV